MRMNAIRTLVLVFSSIALVLGSAFVVMPAVQQLAGLAVAQSATTWKGVKDAFLGDTLSDGIMAQASYLWNGASFDRQRGSIANGAQVDVTRTPGGAQTPSDAFANPSTFQGVWGLGGIFNGTTWDRIRSGQITSVNTAMTTGVTASANYLYDFTGATQNRYRAQTQIGGSANVLNGLTGSFSRITTNTDTFVAIGANAAFVLTKILVTIPGTTSTIVVRTEPDGSAPCGGAGSAIITTASTVTFGTLDFGGLYLANPLCFTTAGGAAAEVMVVYIGDSE